MKIGKTLAISAASGMLVGALVGCGNDKPAATPADPAAAGAKASCSANAAPKASCSANGGTKASCSANGGTKASCSAAAPKPAGSQRL